MKRVLVFVFLIFSISLIAQSIENFQSLLIDEALKENANSILRDEQTIINIPDSKTIEISTTRVITVLNSRGLQDIDAFAHYDAVTKVKSIGATIYNKFGKEIKSFKKKDFQDVSAVSGGTLYGDSRVLYLDYTPTSYPFTVHFESITESANTAHIPSWWPVSGYQSSTQKSSYIINYNPELGFRFKYTNTDERVNIVESSNKFTVSVQNFEAVLAEVHSPAFNKLVPNVLFALDNFELEGVPGMASDWKTFGKWVNDYLLQGTQALPQQTHNEVKQLVANINDPIEKARKIYSYVQNKTRYISVQVGIGGWKPMLAQDVDRLGYGDCKALTNYTKALLQVAEIPSYYTILYGGAKRDIQKDFSSLQGNHVILAIPKDEDYVWLECTSQEIPFGYLGDFTDDRDVLVVTPEGGQIAHTLSYKNEVNSLKASGSYTINSTGTIQAQYNCDTGGMQYDQKYGLSTQTEKERIDHYKEYWSYLKNIEILDLEITNDKEQVSFSEAINFTASEYATFAGDEMLVTLNAFNRSTYLPERDSDRQFDIIWKTGFVDDDDLIIEIPTDFEIKYLPEDITFQSDFGSYTVAVEKITDNQINYKRQFKMNEGKYPKESYKALRTFLKKVNKADNTKMILTKK